MVLIDEGLELMDEEECLRLLASVPVGRVATTISALPVVLPVCFAVVDGHIVFRTGEGTKLSAAVRNAVVAFEVDDFDPQARHGWSVLVIGTAREIVEEDEVARSAGALSTPWVDGNRDRYVSIVPELVSGRRIHTLRETAS